MSNPSPTNIIKVILAVLLLICLLDMPYGYYQLIRILTFVLSGYFAYVEFKQGRLLLTSLFVIAALIFNPFEKLNLGRALWQAVDVIYAGLLILAAVLDSSKPGPEKEG